MSDEPDIVPGNAGRADYPRMVFHPDGRSEVVDTPEAEDALRKEGWGQKPHDIHLKPKPSPSTAAGGYGINDALATLLREVLERVLDERGVGKRDDPEHPPEMPPMRRHR